MLSFIKQCELHSKENPSFQMFPESLNLKIYQMICPNFYSAYLIGVNVSFFHFWVIRNTKYLTKKPIMLFNHFL